MTRWRSWILLVGAVTGSAFLTACGSDDDIDAATVVPPASSTTTASHVDGVGASLTSGRPASSTATTTTASATTATDAPAATAPPQPTVPADVLDLTNWKLTLPAPAPDGEALEVTQPELATFADATFRLAGSSVVFTAPVSGATTPGSSYPRCELREMVDGGAANASWSSTSGTHVMEITQLISTLPSRKPEVVAGQIHDAEDDVLMIRLEDEDLIVEGDGEQLAELDGDYVLGTTFTVRIEVSNGSIRVLYNGEQKLDYAFSGDGLYFKAGVYTQSNLEQDEPPDAAGQVVITALRVEHT
jgi:poly(beta-D-mannuronate) lyase